MSVDAKSSPTKKDIIQPIVYDELGRQSKKYLPYTQKSTIQEYLPDALNEQASFYVSEESQGSLTARPFSETLFDKSPLSRVQMQGFEGELWQTDLYPEHTIKFGRYTNTESELINYTVIRNPENPKRYLLELRKSCPANEFWIEETTDERGFVTKTYTNKKGQTVLQRAEVERDENDIKTWADTYYIYNEVGQVCFVLQPEFKHSLYSESEPKLRKTLLNNFAFQYEYDTRGRVIGKKIPGTGLENSFEDEGWLYMVYDKRDRVVMTQDANQRQKSQ